MSRGSEQFKSDKLLEQCVEHVSGTALSYLGRTIKNPIKSRTS